jgi:hypothetical protein
MRESLRGEMPVSGWGRRRVLNTGESDGNLYNPFTFPCFACHLQDLI